MLTKTRDDMPIVTDLGANARDAVSVGLNALLADVFTLFIETKNFHWHVSGPHFRSIHEMFDEHASQIFAMVDDIASGDENSALRRCARSATSRNFSD